MDDKIEVRNKKTYVCKLCGFEADSQRKVERHQKFTCKSVFIALSERELTRLMFIVRHVQFEDGLEGWFSDSIGISLMQALGRKLTKADIEIFLE